MRRRGLRARAASVLLAAWVGLGAGCSGSGSMAALDDLLGARAQPGLDEGTVVAGLKDALRIGSQNAVATTSRPGGFLDDPRIRIPLPEKLEGMASALRTVGFGPQVDELEVTMNRAAERASAEATEVFWNAIRSMSFADARGILQGGDTAATEYFRRTTSDDLRARFEPIVDAKMREVGAIRAYDGLVARYTALPFVTEPPFEPTRYVTERGLDGLFTMLAEEERRIRTDPAARVTDLLRRVFGSAGS